MTKRKQSLKGLIKESSKNPTTGEILFAKTSLFPTNSEYVKKLIKKLNREHKKITNQPKQKTKASQKNHEVKGN